MSRKDISVHILRKLVIDGFILCGLILTMYAVKLIWPTHQRGFFCGDQSLMLPYQDDTVTVPMLRVVGLGLPILAFLACEWTLLRHDANDARCLRLRIPAWLRGLYCVLISFCIGLCFTEIITDVAKKVIGRQRPHFFDVCQPDVNCSSPEYQGRYIPYYDYTCTADHQSHRFHDARMSFPSGHSSWAAFTMIFFVLYIESRMTWRGTRTLRHALQFAALMLSWFTALSRVSDHKHHWSDVAAGYFLGATMAVLVWNWGTDLVRREKHHSPLAQHELNINSLHHIAPLPT